MWVGPFPALIDATASSCCRFTGLASISVVHNAIQMSQNLFFAIRGLFEDRDVVVHVQGARWLGDCDQRVYMLRMIRFKKFELCGVPATMAMSIENGVLSKSPAHDPITLFIEMNTRLQELKRHTDIAQ